MAERCAALVLAAGSSRRMGAPKALLELGGVPLVRLHVQRALALGYARVLVIVRPALAENIEPLFVREPYSEQVRVISANTPSQASSLAVLVRSLAAEDGWSADHTFLITPVDALPCSDATHRALEVALVDAILAVTPQFAARGGHPVLLRAALLEVYLHGPLESCRPLRDLLAEAGDQRLRVNVADGTVLSDLDTPREASALGLRLPSSSG